MSWTRCFLLHAQRLSCNLSCWMFYHQEALEQEVKGLEERVSAIQQVLGDLKVQLYAKFGNNINLEADESWAVKWTLTAAPAWTFSCSSRIPTGRAFAKRKPHPVGSRLRFVASGFCLHAHDVISLQFSSGKQIHKDNKGKRFGD